MNQDQVKEKLLSLKVPCKDFTLVFSGKASKRVNGLYKPADATIVIHNRNFTNDNALMYTALHEFTHHLMFARGLDTGRNHHPVAFWALFHSLISEAIKAGLYQDPYLNDEKLKEKRTEILELLKAQNELNRKLGAAFSEMAALSKEKGARIEDFIDRHARITRKEAQTLTKLQYSLGLDEVGQESSPALVSAVVGQGKDMPVAAEMASKGCSLQQIKAAVSQKKTIDPFAEPGEEATQGEQLEILEKHLASEVKKKEKLERRICELAQEIERLKSQQYSFGFGTSEFPAAPGRRRSA
jgi:uncharacterized small protein (DUF1192 family)